MNTTMFKSVIRYQRQFESMVKISGLLFYATDEPASYGFILSILLFVNKIA